MPGINDKKNMAHYDLDIKPVPEQVLYINEPAITGDFSGRGVSDLPDTKRFANSHHDGDAASWYAMQSADHVRVYVPLDLSKDCIFAYFDAVLDFFSSADEENESAFSSAIGQVLTRLAIYDQVWYVRELSEEKHDDRPNSTAPISYHHNLHGAEIARVIVDKLTQLADNGCTAERFPYETVDMLCKKYALRMVNW